MAARTVGRFSADLSRFNRTLGGRLDELARNVGFALGEQLIDRTRRDTGNAANHWWPSLNGESPPPLAPTEVAGAPAAEPLARLGPALLAMHHGDTVMFSNNAAYIQVLEHGAANRTAYPMVAPTIAEGPATVERIARQMASGGAAHGESAA